MIPVPASWPSAASGNHRPIWSVDILTLTGTLLRGPLPVTGGQLTMYEGGSPRTEANIDVPAAAVPALLDQALLPTGNRLRLSYRIHPDPSPVVMADLDIVASAIARPEAVWTIAAADRAARVALDDLGRGDVPGLAGMTAGQAIGALVRRTFPGEPVQVTGRAATVQVPLRFTEGDLTGSPWGHVDTIAASAEAEAFYGRATRTCIVRDIPDTADPVDRLSVGEGGQITGTVVKHEAAFNTVAVVYVDPDGGTRTGLWTDTRPDSPVAVQRLGSRVVRATRTDVTALPTQAQADAAAAAQARKYAGRARAAEIRHPARPWLDPGDTVEVTYLGGPTEAQVIESVGIDLGPDNMQVTRLRNDRYTMEEIR